ncbi:MAG: ATP-dependent Clp protease ATP-binding subunit [Spirochaetaceae bacterium]|nr:ATP-dependent Clp protease ATP-binding subunit [Spirochaetaceae bacterium]
MTYELSKNLSRLLNTLSKTHTYFTEWGAIEPEHVLIAIIEKNIGSAYKILEQLDIDIISLQLRLESVVSELRQKNISEKSDSHNEKKTLPLVPLSLRLQQALGLASVKTRALKMNITGTSHLLLAFSYSDICPAFSEFLRYNNKTPEMIEQYVRASLIDNAQRTQSTRTAEQSILSEFGLDLTEKQRQGLLDPVIARETEMQRIIQVLCRRTKNNPVLVGEAGVGKTAIIEGLAAKINSFDVPHNLLNKKIISIEVGSLLAGTKYRGQFEERIKRIIDESKQNKNIILFIDELHTIIGGGNVGQNSLDAADLLKPALARGEIQCIGATTHDEYRRSIEKDSAIARRFQVVPIEEPSIETSVAILKGIKSKYEVFHNVEYTDAAIEKAVSLSARYITERFLPDKAIDVLDEAGATKKMQLTKKPKDLSMLEERINTLHLQKQEYVHTQNYEQAAMLRDEVKEVKKQLELVKQQWQNPQYVPLGFVDETHIAKTISSMTKIPLQELTAAETERLLMMSDVLQSEIIGQDDAIKNISHAIQRARVGISSSDRPIGSFLFLGPTGVGKTLLAKKIAQFLFGKETALVRIDMSDFMEKHTVSRMVGSPPGYVGFENGGVLTEQIRKNPYSVILFDEIEKAHRDVFNILLQVLEEGELQDNLGHTVNFRNTIIIMTSNAGSRSIINENRLGFNMEERGLLDYRTIKQNAEEEIKKFLSPEFINRLDDIIVFEPLNEHSVAKIFELELHKLNERLSENHRLSLQVTESAKQFFAHNGYDASYGARPMRRLIQTEIENVLAEKFLMGVIGEGGVVHLDCINGVLDFTYHSSSEQADESKSPILLTHQTM